MSLMEIFSKFIVIGKTTFLELTSTLTSLSSLLICFLSVFLESFLLTDISSKTGPVSAVDRTCCLLSAINVSESIKVPLLSSLKDSLSTFNRSLLPMSNST